MCYNLAITNRNGFDKMISNRVRYFMTAAEYCNFRQAAEVLFVSEQGLSKQIRLLEEEIGVQLFERIKKRVYLTEAGKYLYDSMRPIVTQVDQIVANAKAMQLKDAYRIGIQDIRDVVNDVVNVLETEVSDAVDREIEYVIGSSYDVLMKFETKEIDLLITFLPDLLHLNIPYEYTTLKKINMGVVCCKDHPYAVKESLRFSDLKYDILYVFADSYVKGMDKNIIGACKKAGFYPRELKYYPDWANMELALRKGAGVSVVYDYFLNRQTDLRFIPIELDPDDNYNHLVAAWNRDAILPVIELLKDIDF